MKKDRGVISKTRSDSRGAARAGAGRARGAGIPARWMLLAAAAGLGEGEGALLGASFDLLPSPPPLTAPLAALTQCAASDHHLLLAAA